MKNSISILCLTAVVCLSSCNTEKKKDNASSDKMEVTSQKKDAPSIVKEMDKADSLVAETLAAHGGERYDKAHYGFKFRDKNYTFHNKKGGYTYTVTGQKDGNEIRDVLENGTLTRTLNGDTTELSPKDVSKYTEALNSVIYFATLPHKLKDAAVNKTYEGQKTIKGQDYDVLAVTFDQKSGGKDHQDEFRYWINTDSNTVDYLAYNYENDDGGVRFRSAYDPRAVGGIRFQNYVNYEAPLGTPLERLPELYKAGKLKELSKIETEDVVVIED
jgi:hypothetical protein